MPACRDCGNFFMGSTCPYCADRIRKEEEAKAEKKRVRDSFPFSTLPFVSGFEIVNHVGVVTGSVALGTGFFSDLRASVSGALGSRDFSFAEKIEEAKDEAFDRVYDRASALGANAVVGVDVKVSTVGDNLIAVVVTGTAVLIKEE